MFKEHGMKITSPEAIPNFYFHILYQRYHQYDHANFWGRTDNSAIYVGYWHLVW